MRCLFCGRWTDEEHIRLTNPMYAESDYYHVYAESECLTEADLNYERQPESVNHEAAESARAYWNVLLEGVNLGALV